MLIIGCGNQQRRDDGAGIQVAERVRELGIEADRHSGEAVDLIEAWKGADNVILVDAVLTGAPVGTVRAWDGEQLLASVRPNASTHGLGSQRRLNLLTFWIAFQHGSGFTESRDGDSNSVLRSLLKYSVLSRKWCEESSLT